MSEVLAKVRTLYICTLCTLDMFKIHSLAVLLSNSPSQLVEILDSSVHSSVVSNNSLPSTVIGDDKNNNN